jgi:hypothetical protein
MYERRNDYLKRREERRSGRQEYPERIGMRGRDYEHYEARNAYDYNTPISHKYGHYPRHYEYTPAQIYDYNHEEKEYEKDLHEWIARMKKKDRFGVPKEQIIHQAKNMGIMFRDFSEDEFYAAYLAMVTDYKKVSNEYNVYIQLAKDFLEDDDTKASNSEKLCKYLYYIVLGEE